MSDLPDIAPPSADRQVELRGRARDLVRRWSGENSEAVIAAGIARLGAEDIAHAAAQSQRLSPAASGGGAGAVLEQLRLLVDQLEPPEPPRWSLFARAAAPAIGPRLDAIEPRLAALLDQLERERDALIRSGIALRGDRQRLRDADARLEEVARLLDLVAKQAEAAAREIAADDPARADLLRQRIGTGVEERRRDVLTQLAVTRQGLLSLDLVADGQDALAGAVERTRHTMAAALRTAVAANRAVAQAQRLAEQAAALDRTVAARPDTPGRSADRAITDAVAQMRAALDAAQNGAS